MEMLIASVTVFVLAVFIGFEIITKVPPTLHTPLMSGSNAISGITIIGALIITILYMGGQQAGWDKWVQECVIVGIIITAVARKLVTIANALCKSRQTWAAPAT